MLGRSLHCSGPLRVHSAGQGGPEQLFGAGGWTDVAHCTQSMRLTFFAGMPRHRSGEGEQGHQCPAQVVASTQRAMPSAPREVGGSAGVCWSVCQRTRIQNRKAFPCKACLWAQV